MSYVERGEDAIIGGDIVLPLSSILPAEPSETERLGITRVDQLWRGGRVRYEIAKDLDAIPGMRAQIENAMANWTRASNNLITFYSPGQPDWEGRIHFELWDRANEGESQVGRSGSDQTIKLGRNVGQVLIEHEIGHALGLWHEHQRPDRDGRVTVNWNNIIEDKKHNFDIIQGAGAQMYGPYDVLSIMHYDGGTFGRLDSTGRPMVTITDNATGTAVSGPTRISGGDIETIRQMYGLFNFTYAGPQQGAFHCAQIAEPADPDTWGDNYLCSNWTNGFAWSFAGPIEGMECIQVIENSEPPEHTWTDNYICLSPPPNGYRSYSLLWSMAGIPNNPNIKSCARFYEPSDPHTWEDNFLCVCEKTCTGNHGGPDGCGGTCPNTGSDCPSGQSRCGCHPDDACMSSATCTKCCKGQIPACAGN